MWVFLASLAMLFLGGAVAYVVVRWRLNTIRAERFEPPLPAVELPPALWISTVAILASSVFLHRALGLVKRDQAKDSRAMLVLAGIAATVFLIAQTPCLISLFTEHFAQLSNAGPTGGAMHGMVATLITIHALHLLGGLWPFVRVLRRAARGGYGAADYGPVHYLTMYWHFLDGVWITLFATLLLTP